MHFIGLFSPIKKKVIFESFHGAQYSDNPRAISEKLHENLPDYKIVWVTKDILSKNVLPNYVTTVKTHSLRYYSEFSSSFAFVTNEAIEPDIYKKRNQFFVQTWHGDRAFKKVLYDAHEGKKRPIPIMDNNVTDVCVSGSNYGNDTYRRSFGYNGKILMVGSPRNDILLNAPKDLYSQVRMELGIPEQAKILLYAPTYRKIKTKQAILVDLNRLYNYLFSKGENWIILLRAHSL